MSGRRRSSKSERFDLPRRAIRTLMVLTFLAFIGVQSARVIERTVNVTHEVHDEEQQIATLEHERDQELHTIARLQRPDGVIPEIHNRLKYAGDNEAIVFLRHPGDGANALVGP
jgi:cell division protein FtsB